MRPAEGERRAVGGYYAQYGLVSAWVILEALRKEGLRWIRVADPEAGRVDDLQVGGEARVDAYQVKWARDGGSFSFNDLVRPQGAAPALIAQLGDGWERLRKVHAGAEVVVHLVTNMVPSVSDRAPYGDAGREGRSFAAFVQEAWAPARRPGTGGRPNPGPVASGVGAPANSEWAEGGQVRRVHQAL